MIAQERIQPLFQPIFDGATGEAFGFEALSRGPANSAHHAPDILFADALRAGCLEDLERACTRASIRSFAELDLHGRLFLNLRPETLLSWKDLGEWLTRELAEAGVDPHCIVIPLLSVSIAAVDVKVAPGMTLDSVAESLRRTKSAAKSLPGCSCMLPRMIGSSTCWPSP